MKRVAVDAEDDERVWQERIGPFKALDVRVLGARHRARRAE